MTAKDLIKILKQYSPETEISSVEILEGEKQVAINTRHSVICFTCECQFMLRDY